MPLSARFVAISTLLAVVLLVCPWPAAAQSPSVSDDPGYVDLDQFEDLLGVTPSIEVNIQGALLEMVSRRAEQDNAEAGRLMQNLRAIQVRGFSIHDLDPDAHAEELSTFASSLTDSGWERVVHVREDDEQVSLYMRHHDDSVAGITLLVRDPGEEKMLFINIVGELHPDDIDKVMGGTGVDLDEVPDPDEYPEP